MNRSTSTVVAALAAAVLSVAGCQTTTPPPAVAADEHTIYPRVTALDGLDRVLRVRESGVVVSRGDVMTVTIPVRSVSPSTEFLQYRFYFYDDAGRPLDTNPTWSRTRVEPRAQAYLEGRSIVPAEDFQLEIRGAR